MADQHAIDKLSLDISVLLSSADLEKVNQLVETMDKLSGVINKFPSASFNKIFEEPKKTNRTKSGGLSGFLKLSKWTAIVYAGTRLGRVVAQIAQAGADYTETLNLWQTAMGNNLGTATEFVKKMNEAYGISEKTLMNAQAIFKNMLGSLGQISDQMAYSLSEGISQMALDYASLYNQTFEQAFTKFQAALAGQVRPIRSVAGYDITENTLFQLYQSLGGTKTMRQLSRTEKQLLSILAIFNQMEASGAVGDLRDTMASFANQSRVMAESWQRVLTYSGTVLTRLLQQSGVMQNINAILIFIGDTLYAVAENMGALEGFEDPFANTTEGAENAAKAIDEVNGKLLGFDQFNSLGGQEETGLDLDTKLLEALSSYDSILGSVSSEVEELAENLKLASGLFDEQGNLDMEKWNEWLGILKQVAVFLGVIFGVKMVQSIITFFTTMISWFTPINTSLLLIATAISLLWTGISKIIDGNIVTGLYYIAGAITAIGVAISILTGSWIPLVVGLVTAGVTALTALIIDNWEAVSTWFMKLINTISNAFIQFVNWCVDALNWLISPIDALVEFFGGKGLEIPHWDATVNWGDVGTFADGGLPDKGSMFFAGEAGAELVANIGGGQSGVMNMEQLESAVARGMIVGLSTIDFQDDRPINIYIDGQRFFSASRNIYQRNGFDVSRIK